MVKAKCPYFTSVTCNSTFIKLKNLRPTLHLFYPLFTFLHQSSDLRVRYHYLKLFKATPIGEEIETRTDLRSHLAMELMDPPAQTTQDFVNKFNS